MSHGDEGETDHKCHEHIPRKGRNGDTPIGYSGQASLRREQCGIFAQSENCGARETAVASERL
jgi:hypothetical protein